MHVSTLIQGASYKGSFSLQRSHRGPHIRQPPPMPYHTCYAWPRDCSFASSVLLRERSCDGMQGVLFHLLACQTAPSVQ